MDFKNLLSALSNITNLQSQKQNQNFSQAETQAQSISYYPPDFSTPQANIQTTQNSPQQGVQEQFSQPNNLASLLPLLGMIFGGNKMNLSQLFSNSAFAEKLGNLKPFLNLFGQKQENENKTPPIDSYKKIED